MPGKHMQEYARRVISGEDANGKSTIVDDGVTARRLSNPALTACDIWEATSLPIALTTGPAEGKVVVAPPEAGFIYRVAVFPPDKEFTQDEFAAFVADMGGAVDRDADISGMHKNDTLDIITVISGEIYAVLETCETLLRQGDTFVMRGSNHAWSNRSDETCKIVSLTMAATR